MARRGTGPRTVHIDDAIPVCDGLPAQPRGRRWEAAPRRATGRGDRIGHGLSQLKLGLSGLRVKFSRSPAKRGVQLETEFNEPPPEFAALDQRDLERLERILAKLALRSERSVAG